MLKLKFHNTIFAGAYITLLIFSVGLLNRKWSFIWFATKLTC